MIVYDLICAGGHRFESWFQSSAAFERQQQDHDIACPYCGDSAVSRAPMAPRVGRGAGEDTGSDAPTPVPTEMREALRQLRHHVGANCEYVGAAFPEEARRIHYGEAQRRDIYGEASAQEATALNEEGVRVQPIPWLPKRDD